MGRSYGSNSRCPHEKEHLTSEIKIAEKITIGSKCWLGTDVYVAPSINIGDFTVVGARSSVFKDLPAGKICLGSPAEPIKDRD